MKAIRSILLPVLALVLVSCGETHLRPAGSGLIEAEDILLSSKASGQVQRLFFDEGEAVTKGDTLGIIDTTDISLRLRQAGATRMATEAKIESAAINIEQASYDLDLAGKEFQRVSSLVESGAADQQQYDRTQNLYNRALLTRKQSEAALHLAKADLARVEAEIALLESQFDDCIIVSPFAGVIVEKYIEAGELAGPGKPLFKIAKLDTVWVKVYLPPSDLAAIRLGDRAEIDPEDGRDVPLIGYVSWISPEAEFTPKNVQTKEARADLVYGVKMTIANPDGLLKIGMPVSITIP
jgi:HlyD family secretion protein